jgi:hypothetical protein
MRQSDKDKESSVERYAAALFLLMSFGPLYSQQPTADDREIASRISRTAAEFQGRTHIYYSGRPYPAGELNSVFAGTRQQLLDDLPPDAAPLRAYVLQRFPASIAGVHPSQNIDMKVCGPYLATANDILNTLRSVSAYRLDLIVDSTPAGGLFELKPVSGQSLARASRGTLTNVWRGIYAYTVSKDGQKTISGTVDLVREKGDTLKCTFVPSTSPGAPMPCEMVTAP